MIQFKPAPPPFHQPDPPIIVERHDGTQAQVSMRNGVAYLWKYQQTDEVFAKIYEIVKWRGCGGFDY